MSRNHYRGVPKKRNVVVGTNNLLDIETVRPSLRDPTPIMGLTVTVSGILEEDLRIPVSSGIATTRETRREHQQIATASTLRVGAIAPVLVEFGSLAYYSFDHPNDRLFCVYKVNEAFSGEASVHVHWTKSDDLNNAGNVVKWRIDYSRYNGYNQEVDGDKFIETDELVYTNSGTTMRYVYASPSFTLEGVMPRDYIAFKVSKLTVSGTPVLNPGLVSVDLVYDKYINRGYTEIDYT